MKRYIGIICAVMLLILAQSCIVKRGANMEFAKSLKSTDDTEVVSIRVPNLLMKSFIRGEIKELKEDDPALALAIKKIRNLKVMTISGDGENHIHEKFKHYLAANKFEELMSIYSDGARISINTKMKGNKIKSILLGIVDQEDQVYVDFKSNLDLDELNKLVEHFENAKDSKGTKSDKS